MSIFDFLKTPDINEGIKIYKATKGAVLLDVRTKEEYADKNIGNSVNLPLDEIEGFEKLCPNKNVPVFVYCRSGKRSKKAVKKLKNLGYAGAVNIGGIKDYK